MPSWATFCILYFFSSLLAAIILWRRGHVAGGVLIRHCLWVLSIVFIFDQAAESRQIWWFPSLSFPRILDVPIENLLFCMASSIIALVCYLIPQLQLAKKTTQ